MTVTYKDNKFTLKVGEQEYEIQNPDIFKATIYTDYILRYVGGNGNNVEKTLNGGTFTLPSGGYSLKNITIADEDSPDCKILKKVAILHLIEEPKAEKWKQYSDELMNHEHPLRQAHTIGYNKAIDEIQSILTPCFDVEENITGIGRLAAFAINFAKAIDKIEKLKK